MWIRCFRFLPLVAMFTAFAVPAGLAAAVSTPCDCCARKPRIDDALYSTFSGQIVIATQAEDPFQHQFSKQVVMIWDLTNQSGAPLDKRWNASIFPPTHPYSHPDWTVSKLGNVFGLTLDSSGNIYVAATRIMGSGALGSLSTGAGNARAGQIYKLKNGTGTPVPFALLPQGAMGEGLGNIDYDCGHDSLYASDFNDGKIYRINAAGVVQPNAWDHGLNLPSAVGPTGLPLGRSAITGFDGTSSYAALGRRVWAVRIYKDHMYYGIWSQDWSEDPPIHSQHGSSPTEIWSVALDANGDPYAPARLEITLPQFSATFPYTNPVSDISFGPLGTMLVAERTMITNNLSHAHNSRLLEYSWTGTQWVLPNPIAYKVGFFSGTNSAGGIDFDFTPGGHFWATGDALHFANSDFIYGLQGFTAGGGDHTTSILIDLNDYVINFNKTQIGDVRLPCPECAIPMIPPVITGPQSACVSPSHYSVAPQAGVTYTWTVTGGTPNTGTGTSVDVTWSGAGTVKVTASGPTGCGTVTSTLQVKPCNINCEFCSRFKTTVAVPNPVGSVSGLQAVTPTVASNMPGITSLTVTLLNASVVYSPAACGISGPLPAFIPQAFASSLVGASGFTPPFLPVPNGNQAIWQAAGPAVSLVGGATTPFQLKLPPPPVFPPPNPCHASYSFCLRVSVATTDCRNCDVIRCSGPFPYVNSGIGVGAITDLVPFALPGVLTFAVPQGSYLAQLMDFLQDQSAPPLPRRFVMDHLSFEPGKAVVTEDSLPSLDQLAMILKASPSLEVRLESYMDNIGDEGADKRLAVDRAQAVKTLLQRAGVPPDRVAVGGLAAKPPASNEPEEGDPANGRVELVVLYK